MTIQQESIPLNEVVVGTITVEGKNYPVYTGRTPTNYHQWWDYYKEGNKKISILTEIWNRDSYFCTSCLKKYGLNSQHHCGGKGYQY